MNGSDRPPRRVGEQNRRAIRHLDNKGHGGIVGDCRVRFGWVPWRVGTGGHQHDGTAMHLLEKAQIAWRDAGVSRKRLPLVGTILEPK